MCASEFVGNWGGLVGTDVDFANWVLGTREHGSQFRLLLKNCTLLCVFACARVRVRVRVRDRELRPPEKKSNLS